MITEINNREDLNKACEYLDRIWDTGENPLGSPERAEFDRLVSLIEAYEDEYVHMPNPTPLNALRYRMECANLPASDLEPYLGSAEQIAAVLAGTLDIDADMAHRLHDGLGVPLNSLLGINDCKCITCRTGKPIPPDK